MEKKNLCVAFSTQKGGAGKTTMTVLVASYLHYVKGYVLITFPLRCHKVPQVDIVIVSRKYYPIFELRE